MNAPLSLAHFTQIRVPPTSRFSYGRTDYSMSDQSSTGLGVAGPFDLIKRLGEGGMGEVFLARHRVLNRDAVVKRILPEHTANEDLLRRFKVEAQAAGKLSHPNIVDVRDISKGDDGRWYMVLEYLRGLSLADWMTQCAKRTGQPVGPWYATIILAQTANALRVAHDEGIVHRDVKPENIFLTDARFVAAAAKQAAALQQAGLPLDLWVKLLDFGIAKLRGVVGGPATKTGVGIGTLSYMSPEQLENARDVDSRADVYSLGVVAYQLLTGGALPWGENTPYVILYQRQTSEPPPDPRRLVPSLSEDIAAVVRGALARSPRDRPSAREFALAFARAVPAQSGFPAGTTLLDAYAEELAAPDGRVATLPDLGPATAPLGRKAPAPVPALPSPTPWMTPSDAPSVSNPTTHSSAVQVRPSGAPAPSSSRRGILVALGATVVVGTAVVVAVISSGGDGNQEDARETAAPVSEPAGVATSPLDALAPDAGEDGPPIDAPVPDPVDAAAPVDAQQIDAKRTRTRPPRDPGDGSGSARGYRDLTK